MSTDRSAQPQPEHRLTEPDGRRRPLKRSVFEVAQVSNTQLCPLFPYLGAGAMVPAISVFKSNYRGGSKAPLGSFYHLNSVDEIFLSFTGIPGMVGVGGRMHPVTDPVLAMGDPDDLAMIGTITQRQVTSGTQHEAYILRCAECHHQLVKHEWDTDPADADTDLGPATFETLTESYEAMARFNADESLRTCSKCGLVNDPFPVARWGWDAYTQQNEVAKQAKSDLANAGA
jgi:hypothetical protein